MIDFIGLKEASTYELEIAERYDDNPNEHHTSDVEERAVPVPVYWLGRRFGAIVEEGVVRAKPPWVCSAPLAVVLSRWRHGRHRSPPEGGRSVAAPASDGTNVVLEMRALLPRRTQASDVAKVAQCITTATTVDPPSYQ